MGVDLGDLECTFTPSFARFRVCKLWHAKYRDAKCDQEFDFSDKPLGKDFKLILRFEKMRSQSKAHQ